MKTIRDVMTHDVVWISPSASAKTAILLLKGHGIEALPVVYAHDSLVGMIYCHSLIGQDENARVVDLMDKNYTTVAPDMPVYKAADLMRANANSHLLVVDGGKLVGIVGRSDVITELGKSYDTLTGLPWQDAFREWGIDALEHGMEISVILIDLNLFGKFNKRYGHLVGDNVLKGVARALEGEVDPARDFLCRYAGDEFAVVTYRKATEADAFGNLLVQRIGEVEVPDMPEKIGGTFGMAGGRRVSGRKDVHAAAMFDDLITNASLNCTLAKPHRPDLAGVEPGQTGSAPIQPERGEPRAARQPRLKIQTIRISTTDTDATAEVTLARGEDEFTHPASGYSIGGRSTLRIVAEAAAGSAAKSLETGHGVIVDDVFITQATEERQIVTVIATFIAPSGTTSHAGSAVVRRSDPYRAAVAALLSAINRKMVAAPQAPPANNKTSE
jgi:IMP dehydrogenase